MKVMIIAGALAALSFGIAETGQAEPVVLKNPPGEPDVTVKVDAPDGTSEQDIAAAIASENAKREPAAREASKVAKQKAAAEEAQAARVGKVCDSIPDDALRKDPSLRRMCGE